MSSQLRSFGSRISFSSHSTLSPSKGCNFLANTSLPQAIVLTAYYKNITQSNAFSVAYGSTTTALTLPLTSSVTEIGCLDAPPPSHPSTFLNQPITPPNKAYQTHHLLHTQDAIQTHHKHPRPTTTYPTNTYLIFPDTH